MSIFSRTVFIISFFILFFPCISIAKAEDTTPVITIVYPPKNAVIRASSTFIIGNTNPQASLKINGKDAKVSQNGAFAEVVPLIEGTNNISLESDLSGSKATLTRLITRPQGPVVLSDKIPEIDESSILPNKNLTLTTGDTVEVKFRATSAKTFCPNQDGVVAPLKASFSIGTEIVPMSEDAITKGLYSGAYKIKPTDNFDKQNITVYLETEGTKVEKVAPAVISTIGSNFSVIGKVITDKAVVREKPDPNLDRLSPMIGGTIVSVNGENGDYYRIKLSDNKTVWMLKKDVEISSLADYPPISDLSKMKVYSDKDNIYLVIPLEYCTPVLIKNIAPNKLELNIYGLKKNTLPFEEQTIKNVISLTYSQKENNSAKMIISTNYKHLWGYDYFFKNKNLIIQITKEPQINTARPLQNISIAIDPGHGGSELGSVGPTCVAEKDINLKISKYLQQELISAGAKVSMTRCDDIDTEIYSRVDIANQNNALILLSIHNNALPDGQDPNKEHGTSAYYYHLQAASLAQLITQNLSSDLTLKNNGTQRRSFVLTRPTKPLSVLVEVAFMINPQEYARLVTDDFQKAVAKSIKKSLEAFLKPETVTKSTSAPAIKPEIKPVATIKPVDKSAAKPALKSATVTNKPQQQTVKPPVKSLEKVKPVVKPTNPTTKPIAKSMPLSPTTKKAVTPAAKPLTNQVKPSIRPTVNANTKPAVKKQFPKGYLF